LSRPCWSFPGGVIAAVYRTAGRVAANRRARI
jgi:hypothetical protein